MRDFFPLVYFLPYILWPSYTTATTTTKTRKVKLAIANTSVSTKKVTNDSRKIHFGYKWIWKIWGFTYAETNENTFYWLKEKLGKILTGSAMSTFSRSLSWEKTVFMLKIANSKERRKSPLRTLIIINFSQTWQTAQSTYDNRMKIHVIRQAKVSLSLTQQWIHIWYIYSFLYSLLKYIIHFSIPGTWISSSVSDDNNRDGRYEKHRTKKTTAIFSFFHSPYSLIWVPLL